MEKYKRFVKEHTWSLIGLAAAVLLLVVCGVLLNQKGIYYKDEFLRKQSAGCWQGQVLGEELTITRTEGTDGISICYATENGSREFLVTGEPEETTRGSLLSVLTAAIVLIVFYVELWCPQLGFHWEVGRFVDGNAEPSDAYLERRAVGLILTGLLFVVVLVMGFLI